MTLLKKQISFTVSLLLFVICMPIIAVFGLGQGALSVLSSNGSTSKNGIIYEGPESKTDLYDYGNCTYWSSLQRQLLNDPIPNTWGNANTWAERASTDGYQVDSTPTNGAIMQTSDGKLGHVAVVTSIDPITGAWTISEMNYIGFDIVDSRTLPANESHNYYFIHDRTQIL